MSPTHPMIPVTSVHLLLALVLISVGCSKAASLDSRIFSPLRSEPSENYLKNGDYTVDLNATNFDQVFRDSPANFAVLEFFANWCPACKNYKPHYEKVARLFNGPNAVHPGVVLLTRVDCALKINGNICDKFSVYHYPMIFWGTPSGLVSGGWKRGEDKSGIRLIDGAGRTADGCLSGSTRN